MEQKLSDFLDNKKFKKKKKNKEKKEIKYDDKENIENFDNHQNFFESLVDEKKEPKNKKTPSRFWNKKEIERFYELLPLTGLDFTLMSTLMNKNRKQLKRKYLKEMNTNKDKINEIISKSKFDIKVYQELLDEWKKNVEK